MAESRLFEKACQALERATHLSQAEARGTLRIALKEAGYEAGSVNRPQLLAVVFYSLPRELVALGLGDSQKICDEIAAQLATG
jgi:hypothetical protein